MHAHGKNKLSKKYICKNVQTQYEQGLLDIESIFTDKIFAYFGRSMNVNINVCSMNFININQLIINS